MLEFAKSTKKIVVLVCINKMQGQKTGDYLEEVLHYVEV